MVQGGHIYGAGRQATFIASNSANAAVICTNAFAFSKVENLTFAALGNGIAFQLDWINSDPGGTAALQSNTFQNCTFGGIGGNPQPAYGLMIGAGSHMGSETSILNCYFGGCTVAGLSMWNYNAVRQYDVEEFSQCQIGILVQQGSINTIHGVVSRIS
jgi:hypothetical protein